MTDESRIKAVMEQCGLVGFEVGEFDGQPQYVAKTAEGRLVGLTCHSDHDDDGELVWWYYDNGEAGWEGEANTLDGALAALEQDFSSAIIASLRGEVERLRGIEREFGSRAYADARCEFEEAYAWAYDVNDRLMSALSENERLTAENATMFAIIKPFLPLIPPPGCDPLALAGAIIAGMRKQLDEWAPFMWTHGMIPSAGFTRMAAE